MSGRTVAWAALGLVVLIGGDPAHAGPGPVVWLDSGAHLDLAYERLSNLGPATPHEPSLGPGQAMAEYEGNLLFRASPTYSSNTRFLYQLSPSHQISLIADWNVTDLEVAHGYVYAFANRSSLYRWDGTQWTYFAPAPLGFHLGELGSWQGGLYAVGFPNDQTDPVCGERVYHLTRNGWEEILAFRDHPGVSHIGMGKGGVTNLGPELSAPHALVPLGGSLFFQGLRRDPDLVQVVGRYDGEDVHIVAEFPVHYDNGARDLVSRELVVWEGHIYFTGSRRVGGGRHETRLYRVDEQGTLVDAGLIIDGIAHAHEMVAFGSSGIVLMMENNAPYHDIRLVHYSGPGGLRDIDPPADFFGAVRPRRLAAYRYAGKDVVVLRCRDYDAPLWGYCVYDGQALRDYPGPLRLDGATPWRDSLYFLHWTPTHSLQLHRLFEQTPQSWYVWALWEEFDNPIDWILDEPLTVVTFAFDSAREARLVHRSTHENAAALVQTELPLGTWTGERAAKEGVYLIHMAFASRSGEVLATHVGYLAGDGQIRGDLTDEQMAVPWEWSRSMTLDEVRSADVEALRTRDSGGR